MKTSIVTDVYTMAGGGAAGDYISEDEAKQAAFAAGDGTYTITKKTVIAIEGTPKESPAAPKPKFTPTPVLTSIAAMKKHEEEVKAKKEADEKAAKAAEEKADKPPTPAVSAKSVVTK